MPLNRSLPTHPTTLFTAEPSPVNITSGALTGGVHGVEMASPCSSEQGWQRCLDS